MLGQCINEGLIKTCPCVYEDTSQKEEEEEETARARRRSSLSSDDPMDHFQTTLDPRKQELLEARFLGARVS